MSDTVMWERLTSLAGKSTYRVPVGGRSTKLSVLSGDQELAAALGMARRRDDPLDIGPDAAFDIATRSSRHMVRVVQALALSLGSSRDHRAIRRSRPWLRIIAGDAYLRLIYGQRYAMPDGIRQDDWDCLTEAAYRVLTTMAEDAVDRAQRSLRKSA